MHGYSIPARLTPPRSWSIGVLLIPCRKDSLQSRWCAHVCVCLSVCLWRCPVNTISIEHKFYRVKIWKKPSVFGVFHGHLRSTDQTTCNTITQWDVVKWSFYLACRSSLRRARSQLIPPNVQGHLRSKEVKEWKPYQPDNSIGKVG